MRLRSPATFLLAVAIVAALAGPAYATDVYGDDAGDRYVGTGGVLLPASVDPGVREGAAECPDCEWRFSTPCLLPAGNPFPGSSACASVTRGCPGGQEFLRLWLQRPGEPWREVGLLCLAPGGPVTIPDLAAGARARLAQDLPALRPAAEPPRGVVTRLPVAFRAGQPEGGLTWSVDIAGRSVRLDARPSWTWLFGDGARLRTSRPGGRFPDLSVSHAYRAAGPVVVRVVATWQATFEVDGFGPFEVVDQVVQEASLALAVGEGRAVLVPGARRG